MSGSGGDYSIASKGNKAPCLSGRILLVDHEDSFTGNLMELLRSMEYTVELVCADEALTMAKGKPLHEYYAALILSPGPGHPHEHGASFELLQHLDETQSPLCVVGICLGCQMIGLYAGAKLEQLAQPRHGLQALISFPSFREKTSVGLYHSWQLAPPLPDVLTCLSASTEGDILAIAHKKHPWRGVQFHPESILTTRGKELISFLLL